MSKLIEKMSYDQKRAAWRECIMNLLGYPSVIEGEGIELLITAILEEHDEQVQLAYIAGWNRLNALTHDCIEVTPNNEVVDVHWVNLEEEFPVTGPDSILPSLYSQSKGFKK